MELMTPPLPTHGCPLTTGVRTINKIKPENCPFIERRCHLHSLSFALPIFADAVEAGKVMNFVDSRYEQTSALARDLWEFAEFS